MSYANHQEISELIEEGVIVGLDFREGGARIHLADGRTLLFPGADTVYVCASKYILQ